MKPMWNNRNLRLLVLGQASSLVGNYTLKFALSMYILEVTGSAALFATFLSVAMVPTIVLSPFGGILADRGDRRRIMVTLDACAGLAVLLAARSCFSTSRTPSPSTGAGGGSWRQHSSRAVTKKQASAPQSTGTSPTAA